MSLNMAIIVLRNLINIFNITHCKLVLNLNFKYRRKVNLFFIYHHLSCRNSYYFTFCNKIIINPVITNTILHVNSFIYFINTCSKKSLFIILHACIIIIFNLHIYCVNIYVYLCINITILQTRYIYNIMVIILICDSDNKNIII